MPAGPGRAAAGHRRLVPVFGFVGKPGEGVGFPFFSFSFFLIIVSFFFRCWGGGVFSFSLQVIRWFGVVCLASWFLRWSHPRRGKGILEATALLGVGFAAYRALQLCFLGLSGAFLLRPGGKRKALGARNSATHTRMYIYIYLSLSLFLFIYLLLDIIMFCLFLYLFLYFIYVFMYIMYLICI